MAIRDRFRRALRPSDSSDSSSQSDVNTSSQTSEQSLLHKSASRLHRTLTWGSSKEKESDPEKEQLKAERKARRVKGRSRRPMHPSEKPLTAQNLKHQEMLGQFTMTFGTRRLSQIEDIGFGGISPCCTRAPSLMGDGDGDADDEISPSISPEGRRSLADAPEGVRP